MLSPGLRLYRFLRGSAPGGSTAIGGSRPAGRLIWLHASDALAAAGFAPLVALLKAEGLADHVLITSVDPDVAGAIQPPADEPALAAAFLDHWRPDLGIWAGGDLRPVLISAAKVRALPMLLADATAPGFGGSRIWPRLMGGIFAPFRAILAVDEAAARAWTRAGAPSARVSVAGRMDEGAHNLPVNEAERVALSAIIGTRPVWLAAGVPPAEEALVIRAHERARRMAHRLLLILVPSDPARIPVLLDELPAGYALEPGYRGADDDPDEDTDVYLADDDEMGLWYRLAPITWAGGTLSGPGPRFHPWQAAAAGSALLHGPESGPWHHAFERLRGAGGSRRITGEAGLAEAVEDLLAADRCARLAHAAWGVTSEGVESTLKVVELVREALAPSGVKEE